MYVLRIAHLGRILVESRSSIWEIIFLKCKYGCKENFMCFFDLIKNCKSCNHKVGMKTFFFNMTWGSILPHYGLVNPFSDTGSPKASSVNDSGSRVISSSRISDRLERESL